MVHKTRKLITIEKEFEKDIQNILKGVWTEKISITHGKKEIISKIHRYINLEVNEGND